MSPLTLAVAISMICSLATLAVWIDDKFMGESVTVEDSGAMIVKSSKMTPHESDVPPKAELAGLGGTDHAQKVTTNESNESLRSRAKAQSVGLIKETTTMRQTGKNQIQSVNEGIGFKIDTSHIRSKPTLRIFDNTKEWIVDYDQGASIYLGKRRRRSIGRKLLMVEDRDDHLDIKENTTNVNDFAGPTHHVTSESQLSSFMKYIKHLKKLSGETIEFQDLVNHQSIVRCSGCARTIVTIGSGSGKELVVRVGGTGDDIRKVFDNSCDPTTRKLSSCKGQVVDTNVQVFCSDGSKSVMAKSKFQPSNICGVDDSKYKACANQVQVVEKRNFVITGSKLTIVDSLQLKYDYDYSNPDQYHGSVDCLAKCFTTHKCKGDTAYKTAFPNQGLAEDETCDIQYNMKKINFLAYNKLTNEFEHISCHGRGSFWISKKATEIPSLRSADDEVTIKCQRGSINVLAKTAQFTQYKLCQGFRCMDDIVSGSGISIDLPMEMKTSGFKGTLTLTYTLNRRSIHDVVCQPTSVCDQIDCDICMVMLMNPKCYKTIHYFIVGVFLTFLLTGLFTLLQSLTIMFWTLQLVINAFLFSLKAVRKATYCAKRTIMSRISNGLRNSGQEARDELEEVVLVRPRQDRGAMRRQIMNMLYILLLINLISGIHSQSCAKHAYVHSDSMTCKKGESGIRTCTVSQVVSLELFPHSFDTCLTLKGKNGRILKTLMFGLGESMEICQQSTSYFTADVKPQAASESHCPGVSYCNADYCPTITRSSNLPFESEANEHLGTTKCAASCGSVLCGCFLAGDSCVVYRQYFTNPTGNTYEVTECTNWRDTVVLQTKQMQAGSEPSRSTHKLTVGERIQVDETFAVTVSGKSSTVSQEQSQFYMKGSVLKYKCGLMNSLNEFNKNKGGFVQCPSVDSAKFISKTCVTDEDVFEALVMNNAVHPKMSLLDFREWMSNECVSLPFSDGIYLYDYDNLGYHRHLKSGNIYSIKVELEDYEVSEDVDDVRCTSRFLSLEGCYQCATGAEVKMLAASSSDSTLMHIVCPSGPATSLTVGEMSKEYSFKLSFNDHDINDNCSVTCGDQTYVMNVKGTLDFVGSPSLKETTGVIERATDQVFSVGRVWTSMLSAAHSYAGYLQVIIASVISLYLSTLLINLASALIRAFRSRDKEN